VVDVAVTEKQQIAEKISKHQKQRNKYLTFKKDYRRLETLKYLLLTLIADN